MPGNHPSMGARTITIASGKGGVGKTSISLNLALALSVAGRRVCLIDADVGMANVDVLLGISPVHSLADYLDEKCTFEELVIQGPRLLKIIPAGSALGRLLETSGNGKRGLSSVLHSLGDYDDVVIDAAAGLSEQVIYLLENSTLPVLVIVPEPTSLTDAYSVLKTFYNKGNRHPVHILLNRVRSSKHAEKVFVKFKDAVHKFIHIPLEMLGHVLADHNVAEAVKFQTPLIERFPESDASKCVMRIATDLITGHKGESAHRKYEHGHCADYHVNKNHIELREKGKASDHSGKKIVNIVDNLVKEAVNEKVSYIHIEPLKNTIRVRFRKHGSLVHYCDFPKVMGPSIVSRIKIMASADIDEKRRHQNGRIILDSEKYGGEIDIHISCYVTLFGEKVVMRVLNKKPKAELLKVSDLGMGSNMLSRFCEEVLDLPSGVVIITGPTGSGKTTTLYAAINYCNNIDTNIITAEEPVEYVIEGISQCSINPKIGVTFEDTLRHIMRQDPDIIILDEIREKFSAESAIRAALTGHKVLTTFHTEDSIGGLLRLINMDIEAFLVSSTVVSVIAQRLLKKVCTYCSRPYIPDATDLRRLKYQASDVQRYDFRVGRGCEHCDFAGYDGRVGVFELLVLNEYVKDAILKKKTSYEIRRISIETTDLITLQEDGIAKAAKGITSLSEVLRKLPLLEAPRPIDQINRLLGDH